MRYHDITKADMKNGDGLRVVLWLAGCGHHCEGCQNPVTWDPYDGLEFDGKAKAEIFAELEKPYVAGITFSGGDPFFYKNITEAGALMKEIKEKFPNKTIWCYTGDTYEDIQNSPNMEYIDVLVDGRFILAQRDTNLMWKGSKNQRVIDVKASKRLGTVVLHCGDYAPADMLQVIQKSHGACCSN